MSPQQSEILSFIHDATARGLRVKLVEVADYLETSDNTVKVQVTRLRKLGHPIRSDHYQGVPGYSIDEVE